jgi:hypothetical protein
MTPLWDDVATTTKGLLNVAKVDCTSDEAKELCSEVEISGYPTFLLFAPGKAEYNEGNNQMNYEKYQGGAAVSNMQNFALRTSQVIAKIDVNKPIELDYYRFNDLVIWSQSKMLKTSIPWFIKFVIPNSKRCDTLAPIWDELTVATLG